MLLALGAKFGNFLVMTLTSNGELSGLRCAI